MKHFLITRFNLKYEGWQTARDKLPVLTKEWLDERFELFQSYCFPSVKNQKNQNFLWAVFFDIDTPDQYRGLVEELAHEYPNFRPLYVDGMDAMTPAFKKFIHENIEPEDDFLITSRIDNDDAIHQDFIDTIQSLAIPKHETVIDFQQGYQMDVSNGMHEYRGGYYYPFNPFVSLVENTQNFETVFKKSHPDWKSAESVIIHKDRPLWIEIVHDKNKANQTRPDLPILKKIKLNDFGIVKSLEERSCMRTIMKNFHRKYRRLYMPYFRRARGLARRKYHRAKKRLRGQPQVQPPQERQQKHDIAGMNRVDIISALAKRIDAQDYLEIGTAYGRVFNAISCKNKVSVDPCSSDRSEEYQPTFNMTSDDFFAQNDQMFDLVFVDGLHEADQIERDINNALKFLKLGGFIVCHDMSPHTESMQIVPRIQPEWTGDGWKAWVKIRSTNPDLEMFVVDTDYGCGVITQGNQTLLDLKGLEMTYENFDRNREEWLNLVSPEDFENLDEDGLLRGDKLVRSVL